MPLRFALSAEIIESRLRATLASVHQMRHTMGAILHDEVRPTLDYLEALVRLHLGERDASLGSLEMLSAIGDQSFFHYDLEIAPLALLRRAQVLDLMGRRDEAQSAYEQVLEGCEIMGVRTAAMEGRTRAFELPKPAAGRLLRDYVLDSPLAPFRRLRPREP